MNTHKLIRILLVLDLITFVGACSATQPMVNQIKDTDKNTIEITLKENGRITASPEKLYVSRGEKVNWISKENFSISFQRGGSPFFTHAVSSFQPRKGSTNLISAPVVQQAPLGTYKYDIRIEKGGQVSILDPIIIVRN